MLRAMTKPTAAAVLTLPLLLAVASAEALPDCLPDCMGADLRGWSLSTGDLRGVVGCDVSGRLPDCGR